MQQPFTFVLIFVRLPESSMSKSHCSGVTDKAMVRHQLDNSVFLRGGETILYYFRLYPGRQESN